MAGRGSDGGAIALDDGWVASLVAASGAIEPVVARSAVVEFTIGKRQQALVELVDGRFTGPADDGAEPDVSLPVTADQLAGFVAGDESMSQAYMRGDVKPVGSTGALLPVLALFDDPQFRAALAS